MYRICKNNDLKTTAVLACILLAFLLLSACPVHAKTVHDGTLGDSITWTLDDAGTLTIIGTGAIDQYKNAREYPWYEYRYDIKMLEIEEGITGIGDNVFYNACPDLERISLPGSLGSIGERAFWYGRYIENIVFSEGITKIGADAFRECTGLSSIQLPVGLTEIGENAFSECTALVSADLPNGLKTIGDRAFSGCSSLAEITIPASVRVLGNEAFSYCSSLETIYLLCSPASLQANFIDYSGTIYYPGNNELWDEENRAIWCKTASWVKTDPVEYEILTSGSLESSISWTLDEAGTLAISGTGAIDQYAWSDSYPWYDYREEVKKIEIGDGITEVGRGAFGLIAAIGSSVKAKYPNLWLVTMADSATELGAYSFGYDKALRKVRFSGDLKKVGDYAFCGCKLKTLELSEGVTELGAYSFNSCALESVKLPEGLQSIGDYAFANCDDLKSMDFQAGMTYLGKYAFYNCKNLERISLPEGLKRIEQHTFYDCFALKDAKLPYTLEEIGENAFCGCYDLGSISLPDALSMIEGSAFSGCRELQTISINSYDHWCRIKFPSYGASTIFQYAPLYETRARLITADSPSDVVLSEGIEAIPYGTFRDNEELTSITLPESLKTIGRQAFSGCQALQTVEAASLDSWCGITFEDDASDPLNANAEAVLQLGGGTGTRAVIKEGIEAIPDRTFRNWSDLAVITLPQSLSRIGAAAFEGCTGLRIVNAADFGSWLKTDFATESSSPLVNGTAELRIANGSSYDSLTELVIDKTVSSIPAFAFSGSKTLKTVVIPEGVTRIGQGAFAECTGLTAVTIPDTITALEERTFSGCTGLKKILIPASVTRIEYDAFVSCAEDLVIYGYEGSAAEIYAGARGITFLPYTEYDSIRTGEISDTVRWTLMDGTALSIEGTGNIPDLESGASPLAEIAGKVISVKISIQGDTCLGDYIFEDFKALTQVNISLGTNVTGIGENTFSGCGNIRFSCYGNCFEVVQSAVSEIDGLSGSTVEKRSGSTEGNVSWSFNEDTGVLILTSNGSNTFGAEFTESPFADLPIRTVEFSDAFSCEDIPANLFRDCIGIKSVLMPERIRSIGEHAFSGCVNLKSLSWYGNVISLGKEAFADCSSLKEIRLSGSAMINEASQEIREAAIEIPEGVTEIPEGCFQNCVEITLVDWYELLEDSSLSAVISGNAFQNCSALTDISLPAYLTAIGDAAFKGCARLDDRDFGPALVTLGEDAFYGCTSIRKLRFEQDPLDLGSFLEGIEGSAIMIEAPESAANLRAYCRDHDGFTFVTTEGIGESQADPDLYVRIATSVTVKKDSTKAIKFTTNGKVRKVTHSGGAGKVSVTRAGNKVRFRGLAAGNPRVQLTFKMKGAGEIKKTVLVTVKKSSASLYEGEEQTLSVDKTSLSFAGPEEEPLEIVVTGAETALAYNLTEMGIVEVSIGAGGVVTVIPKKSGNTKLKLQAVADEIYDASNTVSIDITVKAPEDTGNDPASSEGSDQDDTGKDAEGTNADHAEMAVAAGKLKVTGLTVKAKAGRKAKLTWNPLKKVSGYEIKYCMDKKFKKKARKLTVKKTKKKTATVKKLKPGKKYFFKIRPYTRIRNAEGKTVKTYGKWSKVVKVKAKK